MLRIMARLRGPGGCPWDREQTHQSIRHNLIEECYEALDALDGFVGHVPRRGGGRRRVRARGLQQATESFKDELGDMLLQIVFHAQMASETGGFDFDDVAKSIGDKLVRRHPHVFGRGKLKTSAEVLQQWEVNKKAEKNSASILNELPRHLPALLKADKVQRKVARVGFDWKNTTDVVAKVEEELRELQHALASGNRKQFEEEVGDLLFAVVNLARFEDRQAEELLNRTIAKFVKRFQQIEKAVYARGRRLEDCTLAELDALWESTKRQPVSPARKSKPSTASQRRPRGI